MTRKLHLNIAAYGVGGVGAHGQWKDPRIPKNASIDIKYYIRQAQVAEAAKFDAFFIADSQFINATYPNHYLSRLEPLTLLSAVGSHTEHIGVVATCSSTYNSPFNLARRLLSMDHISGGRAAWNVVTSFDSDVAKNFGLDEHLDYSTRYAMAEEFVEVARGLWDSYEDDAFVADVERNLFLDPTKLHALNHEGRFFKVAGPLNLARSPQGQPVIFQAGVSEEGRQLAAKVAEGIYAPGSDVDAAKAYHADIKRRAVELGRHEDHVVIFTAARPVVGPSDEAAHRRSREIYEEDNDFDRKLGFLGRSFGAYDFTQHDLDAPFPDLTHLTERGGRNGAELVANAKAQGLTLRQVVEQLRPFNEESPFVGSPTTVADAMQRWFEEKACDGFNLSFRTIEEQQYFSDTVVPILQKRGIFRTEYEGTTLRANLGLPVPANRYVAQQTTQQTTHQTTQQSADGDLVRA